METRRKCLVLVLLLVLREDERPAFTRAAAENYTVTEGRDISIRCQLHVTGEWTVFCKNHCRNRSNVLIETSDVIQRNGRYSIRYTRLRSDVHIVRVGISDVRLSDSGRYSCGVESWVGVIKLDYQYKDLFIQVMAVVPASAGPSPVCEEPLCTPSEQPQERTTTAPSGLSPRPFLFYTESSTSPSDRQQDNTTSAFPGVLLCVGGTLAAVVSLVFITVFTLFCKMGCNKSQEGAPDTEMQRTQTNPRENECAEENSTCDMEDSSVVIYAEVKFRRSSGDPRCRTEPVVYAVPQVQSEETSLYSTINISS